jgi:3-oxocholest-4-en-26-oyl-CoA dehydrogenase beta subunit
MDFALSEEQEMLRKVARDFLETECPKSVVKKIESSEPGYSPELWKKMAEMGWLGLAFPEEYGGEGGSLLDLAIIFEELGRAACPSPMFTTIALGALPILEAGSEEQKKELLPKIAKGELILTLALTEPEADYEPGFIATQALKEQAGFSISGTKLFIQNAHIADYMLVVARTKKVSASGEGISVFIVGGKTPGITCTPLVTVGGDKQFEVALNKVVSSTSGVLGGLHKGWPLVQSTLQRASALQCVEMLGVAEQELKMTAEYAKTRVQFGRPIGTFQAVQHRLADMFTDVEGMRWITYQALWRLSEGLPAAKEVAIAQAWSSDACQRVAVAAQHLHGGIGMDIDYDLHYYFRLAKMFELNLGTAPYHKKVLEAELL